MDPEREMHPDFSRTAGRVLASPYFVNVPENLTGEPLRAWWRQKHREKDTLEDALNTTYDYPDLKGEAKDIYDRAYQAIVQYMDEMDYYERFHE